MNRRETAYHEAGHAVVAVVLGVPVESLSVVASDDDLGRMTQEPTPALDRLLEALSDDAFDESEHRTDLEECVMVFLAGKLAAVQAGFDGVGGEGDDEKAWSLVARATRNDEETAAYLGWLSARTATELRLAWPAVEELANTLLGGREELDGETTRALIYGALRRKAGA